MGRQDTRQKLIDSGEYLFSTQGIDAVSLRQVANAAGQRNPAVVQYHFESKEGLLRAIVADRLRAPEKRRGELLAQLEEEGRTNDVHALLECAIYPIVDLLPERRDFLRLLTHVHANEQLADIYWNVAQRRRTVGMQIVEYLEALLDHLPADVRPCRIRTAFHLMLQGISNQISQEENGIEEILRTEVFVADLLNAFTAFLLAPAPTIMTVEPMREEPNT